jgi:hypothetical protein
MWKAGYRTLNSDIPEEMFDRAKKGNESKKNNIRTRIPGVEPGAVERAVNCWNS